VRLALIWLSALGPERKFSVGKRPFGLILRYLRTGYVLRTYRSPASSPFGLSLSKPLARGTKAPFDRLRAIGKASSAWPFDKLRANGGGEPTVVNGRFGPTAEAGFFRHPSSQARKHP
jgi:hypothetical protein